MTAAGNLQNIFSSLQVWCWSKCIDFHIFTLNVWFCRYYGMHLSYAACWLLPRNANISSDILDFTSFRASGKNVCYGCWCHNDRATFFTPFLHEHCQSWTHWRHLFGHLRKHLLFRKRAIILSGWVRRRRGFPLAVLVFSHSKSHSYVGLSKNTPDTAFAPDFIIWDWKADRCIKGRDGLM